MNVNFTNFFIFVVFHRFLVGAPLANNPKSLDVRQKPQGGILKCDSENWSPNDCEYIAGIGESE